MCCSFLPHKRHKSNGFIFKALANDGNLKHTHTHTISGSKHIPNVWKSVVSCIICLKNPVYCGIRAFYTCICNIHTDLRSVPAAMPTKQKTHLLSPRSSVLPLLCTWHHVWMTFLWVTSLSTMWLHFPPLLVFPFYFRPRLSSRTVSTSASLPLTHTHPRPAPAAAAAASPLRAARGGFHFACVGPSPPVLGDVEMRRTRRWRWREETFKWL